jgi:Phage integrase family/Transposase DNA-binding
MKKRQDLACVQSDHWIDSELANCNFHDLRHGKRLRKLLGQLADRIDGTIPWAGQDWDRRLLEAFMKGMNDISDELVFPSPDGCILDPDNLYHRYFLPVLAKAGIRKIRLHDLRHTFGSLLIQAGASLVYVKEQMGHNSIQITVDTYGHLIPGANTSFVDCLDTVLEEKAPTTTQQSATQTQPALDDETGIPAELVDLIGGGGRTRTYDLRIMRPSL